MDAYTIHKASEYGFFVTKNGSGMGEFCPILCAGAFDECVAYIRSRVWPSNTFDPCVAIASV